MAEQKKPSGVSITRARGAAKRLSRSRDFQTLEKYLAKKARHGKSPFVKGDSEDTMRLVGRQEQHQLLVDLVNGKTGEAE